jgi:hypothetical protein
MKRQAPELESQPSTVPVDPPPPAPVPADTARTPAMEIHHYGEDLERRYITARNAWTLAMRIASSGRAADMASLAIAQEAYEAVAEEREHWLASGKVSIPIEPEPSRKGLEAAVVQELEWRKLLHPEEKRGLFARIRRRFGGR